MKDLKTYPHYDSINEEYKEQARVGCVVFGEAFLEVRVGKEVLSWKPGQRLS